ncbi:MAG: hypothetical protein KKI08_08340 [Armatimonadetes bacterium]|nr:hypothetical protein [Armatimonadota bacterium]
MTFPAALSQHPVAAAALVMALGVLAWLLCTHLHAVLVSAGEWQSALLRKAQGKDLTVLVITDLLSFGLFALIAVSLLFAPDLHIVVSGLFPPAHEPTPTYVQSIAPPCVAAILAFGVFVWSTGLVVQKEREPRTRTRRPAPRKAPTKRPPPPAA